MNDGFSGALRWKENGNPATSTIWTTRRRWIFLGCVSCERTQPIRHQLRERREHRPRPQVSYREGLMKGGGCSGKELKGQMGEGGDGAGARGAREWRNAGGVVGLCCKVRGGGRF